MEVSDSWNKLDPVYFTFKRSQFFSFKVSSHLEEVGTQAVEEQFATIRDVVGNAFADEVVESAAKLRRPTLAICKEADLEDTEAFLVCIRIGLPQARHWEQSEDAWLYEAPVETEPESFSTEVEILKVSKNLVDRGYCLVNEVRTNL